MFAEIIATPAFCTFNLGSIPVFEKRNRSVSLLDAWEASGSVSVDPRLRKGVVRVGVLTWLPHLG